MWRRQGVGRALVQHAVEHAEAAGASCIDLTANEEKQAGRPLYRALGSNERDTASFRLHIAARSSTERSHLPSQGTRQSAASGASARVLPLLPQGP